MTQAARRAPSIRTRLTGSLLLLLLFVFLLVAVSFNATVNSYIRSRSLQQLREAQAHVSRDVPDPPGRSQPQRAEFSGTMQQITGAARRAVFVTQVQTMVVAEDYSLIFPTKAEEPAQDEPSLQKNGRDGSQFDSEADEKQAVLSMMRESGVDLQSDEMHHLASPRGTIYYVSMAMPGSHAGSEQESSASYRLVLYTNMTDIAALAKIINRMLMIIIGITAIGAFAVLVAVSGRITRPIRALSRFAEALGRNDFSRREITVHDRELIEMLGVMNHTAEQLDTYDREQKTFFQNVSHELRTPLMSIKGYAEGIEVGVFDDAAQAARVIVTESDHLTSLVEDLLYLSRMDNITQAYETAPCDVRELLSNCAQSLQGIALREGKEIAFDFPAEAAMALCDEQHLHRALCNLVANGLRYAQHTVTLRVRAEGGLVRATISDDGPGIALEDLPHVFDRFYKGRGGKHGIGLSIAQAVAKAHQGEIHAANGAEGAVFTLTLPLMPREL